MAHELELDEWGADQVRDWLLRGETTAEERAFVRSVLEGVAVRRPHEELGQAARDQTAGQVAITNEADSAITVVIQPYGDDADRFSVVFVGDLRQL